MATKKQPKRATLKSITAKALNDGKEVTKDHIGKVIANIGGIVDSYFTVTNKYGDNIGFKGDFIAVNPESGNVYDSEAIFLPQSATDLIMQQLKEGQNEIVLNLSLKVTASDKNSKGIAYVCDNPETETRKNRRAAMQEAFANNFNVPLALEG